MNDNDKFLPKGLKSAILQKALGYEYEEKVQEYSCDTGEEKLVKQKITTKHIPPDYTAIRMILEMIEDDSPDLCNMSIEELKDKKSKLLEELREKNTETEE